MEQGPLVTVASPFPVYSWVAPIKPHTYDLARCEDSAVMWCDDLPVVQTIRDWNEEYQTLRSLPRGTRNEKLVRARSLFKFSNDYVAAATRGAMAVVDGLLNLNPQLSLTNTLQAMSQHSIPLMSPSLTCSSGTIFSSASHWTAAVTLRSYWVSLA